MNETAEPGKKTHILDQKVITCCSDWNDWLAAWNSTYYASELDGLIHVGMDIAIGMDVEHNRRLSSRDTHEGKIPDAAKAVIFYLELADGHMNIANFCPFEGPNDYNPFSERACLSLYRSRKALKIISATFFRGIIEKNYFWTRVLLQKDVFEKVLWFYRPGAGYSYQNFHAHDGRHEKSDYVMRPILQFTKCLADFCIRLSKNRSWVYRIGTTVTEDQVQRGTALALDILDWLGEMDCFIDLEIEYITADLLLKLKQLVIADSHSLTNGLDPRGDTTTARTLVVLMARSGELKLSL